MATIKTDRVLRGRQKRTGKVDARFLPPPETNPTKYQTRGVLAGAYRGKADERALLTHLVDTEVNGENALCRKVKPGHMADEYSDPAGLDQRPTCQVCGAKWDRLHSK